MPLELSITDAVLRGYPWELSCAPQGKRHGRIGGLIRRAAEKASPPTDASNWPVRVLIVTGTPETALPAEEQIGTDKEVDALRRALADYGRSVDLRRVMPEIDKKKYQDDEWHLDLRPTLAEYQPHVLHFIGHGSIRLSDNSYELLVQHPEGNLTWNTSALRDAFIKAECIPRLVFLNCCRSAEGLGVASEATLGLQNMLMGELGVPAVIAMQADVRGDLATRFSEAFYRHALTAPPGPNLEPPSLIAAVQAGREKFENAADIDWALPSLTLCADVPTTAGVWTRHRWSTDPPFLLCREFNDARVYADDAGARRQMIQWMFPVRAGKERHPNVLIVRGAPGSGKSRLLHWCMESWSKDAKLRQLTVEGLRGRNCLGWLIQLRAGTADDTSPGEVRFLREPLAAEAFEPFYEAVAEAANLLDGPDRQDDPAIRRTQIDDFTAQVTDDKSVARLYDKFIKGLETVAKGPERSEPIILIFDQLSAVTIATELFRTFRDSFLKPIGERPTGDVRVVLSVSSPDYDRLELAGLAQDAARVVDVTIDYTNEALETLAVEALRYRYEEQIRLAARATLSIPDESRNGLAKLYFCQNFLLTTAFRNLGRMQ
jgi:hypothetical protein